MAHRFILIIMAALFNLTTNSIAAEGAEENFDLPAISGALKQAEENAAKMTLPENLAAATGRTAAESVMKQFQASEYQAGIQAERKRLRQTVFREVLDGFEPQGNPALPAGKLEADERIYLFVSSSIELPTLRSYAAVIDKVRDPNVVMVLRGFVGGMKKIKPTMEFIGNVLKMDPACDPLSERCESYNVSIQVDPMLFRRFQIEQVPTVVFISGLPDAGEIPENHELPSYTISGDAGLDWLLEKINREAKSETLAGLIGAMRHGEDQ